MNMMLVDTLIVGLTAMQVVSQACDNGASVALAGSAMLQSQTDVMLDAGTSESHAGMEVSTLKTKLAQQPLVAKVATLEGEVEKLLGQVDELLERVGIPKHASAAESAETVEAASLLQEQTLPKANALKAAPRGTAVFKTSIPKQGLNEVTQGLGLEQLKAGTLVGDTPEPESVVDTGGPLRGRIAVLETKVAALRSYIGTIENEVLGRVIAALLQSQPGRHARSTDVQISLKGRVLNIEDKVDSMQSRVAKLRHEILG